MASFSAGTRFLKTFSRNISSHGQPYGSSAQAGCTSGLTSEATDLLAALQNFVVSLTAKNAPQRMAVRQETAVRNTWPNPATNTGLPSTPIPPLVTERPPLPKWILERVRNRVFNRMPIRMLTFNRNGTDIRLVERPEILSLVSRKITEEFSRFNPRLLSIQNEDDINRLLDRQCAYAILSHTWLRESPGEVTFSDWTAQSFDKRLNGYRKLEMFCRVAALNHGFTFGWMDTCCIDKSSSSELDESIRSMFRWYKSSALCVTYLADTIPLEDMHRDTWFTRGWTLQELIAPDMIKFYSKNWKCLAPRREDMNDKYDGAILEQVRKATTITPNELREQLSDIAISRRMQWAAKRNVTREEDTAYSLMGIFNVSISTAYGEGAESAFKRLVQEILSANHSHSAALDIVNWGQVLDDETDIIGLLPPSPDYYVQAVPNIVWHEPYEPVVSTPLGLRVSVLVMPALGTTSADAKYFSPMGDYYAIVHETPTYCSKVPSIWRPVTYSAYNVLDNRMYGPYGQLVISAQDNVMLGPYGQLAIGGQETFSIAAAPLILGVLNFKESQTAVEFARGEVCFSIVLTPETYESVSIKEATFAVGYTTKPITFKLETVAPTYNNIKILKQDLHKHGMTLRTMYL